VINFKAIAFGRIGGQNINIKIAETKYDQIKKMGMDPEIILSLVQKKIIEGDIIFNEKNLKAREAME
jgi:DNA helicase TIP49 (TBP-interacting protein)